jgi:hypothetical protein
MSVSILQKIRAIPGIWITSLVVAINLLVLINNILHDPGIGYDAQSHLDYVYVMPYRLPTPEDTSEFFSAPLPYLIPSITNLAGQELFGISDTEFINGRTAQLMNFLLSIGITFFLVKICRLIAPQNGHYAAASLMLLGILPVYYKTFTQVRGEPYVVFFTILIVYLILTNLQERDGSILKRGIYLGLALGLLGLSRQWGFLVYPAIATFGILLFLQNKPAGREYFKSIAIAFMVAFLVAGWFYIRLYTKYGTVTAFNREERRFSLSNQPPGFYRNTGLGDLLLFKAPTRPVFNNQLLPTFYSEIWGDYWGFFVFIKEAVPFYGNHANQAAINPYLGRMNFVSLFPTLLYGLGLWVGFGYLARGLRKTDQTASSLALALLTLIIVFSAAGYFWFLIKYPEIPRGTTIKATYMLHAIALLPLLTAAFLEKLRAQSLRKYGFALAVCGLIFLHNLPGMITRYSLLLK